MCVWTASTWPLPCCSLNSHCSPLNSALVINGPLLMIKVIYVHSSGLPLGSMQLCSAGEAFALDLRCLLDSSAVQSIRIGSSARRIDPTFQKIWMCSMANEFSTTTVIWTYLCFNLSELKTSGAIMFDYIDRFLSKAWDIWFVAGEKWILVLISGEQNHFPLNILTCLEKTPGELRKMLSEGNS